MIELSDPYVKLIVETLIKTATSKTVELGINGVSKLLGKAIKDGNKEEAAIIIRAGGLENAAGVLADSALSSSYVVPFIPTRTATADDKLEVFCAVIRLGTSISKIYNSDICLPGSILGVNTVTYFTTKGADVKISKNDRTFSFSFEPSSGTGIFYEKEPIVFCDAITESLKLKREVSTRYISLIDVYESGHLLRDFTTMSVTLRGRTSPTKQQIDELQMHGDTAYIQDWHRGIEMMLTYAKSLPEIDALSDKEGVAIFSLSQKLSEFYN